MERSVQKNGLINLLALLGVGVASLGVASYCLLYTSPSPRD